VNDLDALARTLPVVIHIGYHKTASTWLQRVVFPSQPRLVRVVQESPARLNPFLAAIVGPHDADFDPSAARDALDRVAVERLRSEQPGPDGLEPASRVLLVSAERLSGHAASGGYDTHRIADRLAAALEGRDVKVCWLVREQVSMIESQYRQLVAHGFCGPIEALWAEEPGWRTVGPRAAYYEYDRLADHYAARFGRERVAVWPYERLAADRDGFLTGLAAFCGVGGFGRLSDEAARRVVNPSLPARGLWLHRALNRLRRTELNPYAPVDLGPRWRAAAMALTRRLPPRAALLPERTRRALRERYAPSNARLAERYGVRFDT